MTRGVRTALLLPAVLLLAASQVSAQINTTTDIGRPKLGLGVQSSYPAWGVSAMFDVTDQISAQGIAGLGWGWTTLSARGLYRVAQRPNIDPYAYGMVGLWTWNGGIDNESALSFGAGAGVDLDLRMILPDLPPIFWNLELGLGSVNLGSYNGFFLSWGGGLHYRF